MADKKPKRSYGSASLFQVGDSWYGKWRTGKQIKRKVGKVRKPGTSEGLTKTQAEKELRRLMREVKPTPHERLSVGDVGRAYIAHLRDVKELKPSTIQDYEGILRKADAGLPKKTVDKQTAADVEGYGAAMKKAGRKPKTIANHFIFLHGLFAFAVKRGWAPTNVVDAAERPKEIESDPDIHFLTPAELDALLPHIPDDTLGTIEPALYVTAAMTGLRQGELIALRRKDVDFKAGVIRVRKNFTRGKFGTPKSRRSKRAVPMAKRVAVLLRAVMDASPYKADDDLVFGHPETGNPLDASKLRKRFKVAIKAAGVRKIRFHDLRHTFGTQMAAVGVPMRTLQEWMGHRDHNTTLVYADYAPDPTKGAQFAEAAFGDGEQPADDGDGEDGDQAAAA